MLHPRLLLVHTGLQIHEKCNKGQTIQDRTTNAHATTILVSLGGTPDGIDTLPNESRLSCGALKKIHSAIYARRQLQALVRPQGTLHRN